jgi:hypothetical protein
MSHERRKDDKRAYALAPLLALGLWATASGCERSSRSGAPAGLPPLSAAPVTGPPGPRAAAPSTPASAGPPLPRPSETDRQALQQALGMPASPAPDVEAGLEAVADVPDAKHTISGTITLPGENRARVSRGDTIFLAARRAGGPPGPGSMIAVQKLQAEDFPMRFTLSGRDAMIPGIPFEGRMSITVRVDKDGDALTRKKGDVYGHADGVAVGKQDVTIALDTLQTEDRLIATPDAVQRAMLPSGHP